MNDINPLVTFRQINKAFNKRHEAVMSHAQAEAEARTKDPVEAATRIAALGNALVHMVSVPPSLRIEALAFQALVAFAASLVAGLLLYSGLWHLAARRSEGRHMVR